MPKLRFFHLTNRWSQWHITLVLPSPNIGNPYWKSGLTYCVFSYVYCGKPNTCAVFRPAFLNLLLWFDLLDTSSCYSSTTAAQQPRSRSMRFLYVRPQTTVILTFFLKYTCIFCLCGDLLFRSAFHSTLLLYPSFTLLLSSQVLESFAYIFPPTFLSLAPIPATEKEYPEYSKTLKHHAFSQLTFWTEDWGMMSNESRISETDLLYGRTATVRKQKI